MTRNTISDDYLKLQQELHLNPNYGVASLQFAPLVAQLVKQTKEALNNPRKSES